MNLPLLTLNQSVELLLKFILLCMNQWLLTETMKEKVILVMKFLTSILKWVRFLTVSLIIASQCLRILSS